MKIMNKKFIERTNALPKGPDSRVDKKRSIDLGLDILTHHVQFGERVSAGIIAAVCDCSATRIRQYERRALMKIRKRLRIALSMDHGQFALSVHTTV